MVNYTVSLPPTLGFAVGSINGAVTVTGMSGGGSVSLINGNVDAALQVPSDGSVNLTTINGEIALRLPRSTSATFSAQLTNGTITLTNLMLQTDVRTNRSVQGTLGSGDGTVALTTTNGAIHVTGT